VKEKINQFDIARLRNEIRSVLRHKRKRAFAFVGKQGVGKSSILRVIEETMKEYMVIHLTADDFEYARTIRDRFDIAKQFQPLIIMIEDLDSCGLREKGSRTGAFLECIDEVNDDLNMVILVTINDTSLIHRTILDRPGRFDRVFEITPPKSIDEVYQVLESKIGHIRHNYCNGTEVSLMDKNLMSKILKRCVDEKFTQAELTNAITEQALIDMDIEMEGCEASNPWEYVAPQDFVKFLEGAVDKHCETKKAIKEYKFNDQDPDMNCPETACEGQVSRAYGDYPHAP
jgi:AAA+ superfamily predicted ATPase